MKVVYHPDQKQHYPKQFLVNGCFQPNPEMPERLDRLLEGALAAGCTPETPSRQGMALIEAVHSPAYLKFLEHAHERWMHIDGAAEAVTPNIHPDSRDVGYPASVVAQAGYHMSDASAPITGGTWNSACWSAWTHIAWLAATSRTTRSSSTPTRPCASSPGTPKHACGKTRPWPCIAGVSSICR